MQVNLLANPEHYRTGDKKLDNKTDVINYIEDFLGSNVNATDEQFGKIFQDLEKDRNHEIRFDDSEENIEVFGNVGNRVAYGAFRHSALVHSTQTVWTYTFQIIRTDNGLYLSANSWGWLHDTDLSGRVSTHLE